MSSSNTLQSLHVLRDAADWHWAQARADAVDASRGAAFMAALPAASAVVLVTLYAVMVLVYKFAELGRAAERFAKRLLSQRKGAVSNVFKPTQL